MRNKENDGSFAALIFATFQMPISERQTKQTDRSLKKMVLGIGLSVDSDNTWCILFLLNSRQK